MVSKHGLKKRSAAINTAVLSAALLTVLMLIGTAWGEDVQEKAIRFPSAAPPALEESVGLGDLYALVIGVSQYSNPEIPALRVSDKDARDFAGFLKTQKKLFNDMHVTLLLNEEATQREVKKQLFYSLRKAGKKDTVILFFSGHGADDPNMPGEFFFLTHDADPNILEASAVNMSRMRFMDRLDSKRVVLIADTCHAGGFSVRGTKSIEPAIKGLIRKFQESEGRVILSSSRPDEVSLEKEDIGNSLFTYYLIKGLEGAADENDDKIVTLQEAYEYVYESTKENTKGVQHPQMDGKVTGAFPLAYLEAGGPSIRIAVQPTEADIFIREQSHFKFVDRTDASGYLSLSDLPLNQPVFVMAKKEGWKERILGPFTLTKEKPTIKPPPVKLEKSLGFLVVRATVPGAEVSVGDRKVGKTGPDGFLMVDKTQVGVPLEITLRKEGLPEKKFMLTIPKPYEGRVYSSPYYQLGQTGTASGAFTSEKEKPRIAVGSAGSETRITALPERQVQADDDTKTMSLRPSELPDEDGKALRKAASKGDRGELLDLIAEGARINSRDDHGKTPLMAAVESGHIDAVRLLLDRGALVNAEADDGITALMLAAKNGHTDVARELIESGADLNATDGKRWTAAKWARLAGNMALGRRLSALERMTRKGEARVIDTGPGSDCLQVKQSPSAGADEVGCLKKDQKIRLTGKRMIGNWVEVRLPVRGWVASQYLAWIGTDFKPVKDRIKRAVTKAVKKQKEDPPTRRARRSKPAERQESGYRPVEGYVDQDTVDFIKGRKTRKPRDGEFLDGMEQPSQSSRSSRDEQFVEETRPARRNAQPAPPPGIVYPMKVPQGHWYQNQSGQMNTMPARPGLPAPLPPPAIRPPFR
jgi:hypothetical protein